MGKKKQKDEAKKEKPIFGSGADIISHEDEQGKVKCKCIVPCVWRGYRDEGDTVWIEKEMIEKDDFIRMHFEEVKKGEWKREEGRDADGADGSENPESDNGNGESDNADGGSDNADGGSENADGADGNGDGADGNGQGELELK